MYSKLEQHVGLKFCFKSGYAATDTFKLLQKAYSCECLSCTMVFKWFGWFCASCLMTIQERADHTPANQLKRLKLSIRH